jgi:hypothetical protein
LVLYERISGIQTSKELLDLSGNVINFGNLTESDELQVESLDIFTVIFNNTLYFGGFAFKETKKSWIPLIRSL